MADIQLPSLINGNINIAVRKGQRRFSHSNYPEQLYAAKCIHTNIKALVYI